MHVSIPGALDTTVMSGTGLGAVFAPTWSMVNGHKNHITPGRYPLVAPITWDQYHSKYVTILDNVKQYNPKALEDLVAFGQRTGCINLKCYCSTLTHMCHNEILIRWLLDELPDVFWHPICGNPEEAIGL
jgi:hypothetical protein